jgi:hypothetical protein
MDRHERPYVCMEPACRSLTFPAKGGLKRHRQSVHGERLFKCPIASCTRHKKGFARRDNLVEHQKRVHPSETFRDDGFSFGSSTPIPGMDDDWPSSDVSQQRDENQCGIAEPQLKVAGLEGVDIYVLQAKLQELEAERARLDDDIMAVKRTLQLVTPSAA